MSEQPDPLDRLSRFGSDFEGGAMPLPASEIRRRGDRIRRRRNALVTGGTALAVAAIATPIFALTQSPEEKDTLPAQQPETVTTADLLSDAETVYSDGADWFTTRTETYLGEGPDGTGGLGEQAAFHPCTQESFEGLGATSLQTRYFELLPTIEVEQYDGPTPANELSQAVAQFDTPRQARAAYDAYVDWIGDCGFLEQEYGDYRTFDPLDVEQPAEGRATILQANYGLGAVDEEIDPFGDFAYITETGLAVSGDRLTVARIQIAGQDYNFLEGTPMQQMLPVAAELMLPGGEERPQEPAPTFPTQEDPTTASVTELPDDFALDAGWETFTGPDYEVAAPSRDLAPDDTGRFVDACGARPEVLGATDRMTTEVSGVAAGYTRDVFLFADSEAAQDAFDALAGIEDCRAEDGAVQTTYDVRPDLLGDDSLRIIQTSTVGGEPSLESTQVRWIGRFGTGVFVMTGVESGSSADPTESGDALLDAMLADADPVTTALGDLLAG